MQRKRRSGNPKVRSESFRHARIALFRQASNSGTTAFLSERRYSSRLYCLDSEESSAVCAVKRVVK